MTDAAGRRRAVAAALGASLLFGASTPFAKSLLGSVSPLLLAGLLYLGSGLGLTLTRTIRDGGWRSPGLTLGEWPWLIAAITFGGLLGPVLLMLGLQHSSAASASLLLNLEAVLTAVLAWTVFREHTDLRVVVGMAAIVVGALLLVWRPDVGYTRGQVGGVAAIVGACLCWALDNNLTRKVAGGDALFIAGSKGLAAGLVNTALALALGARLPAGATLGGALAVGLLGYGVSLVLYVLALRGLGSARTGAYFSTAPFIGATLAVALFGEPLSPEFAAAAVLMGLGVWLHVSEHHAHPHQHAPQRHTHAHRHDAHHQHDHGEGWDGDKPHSHAHVHVAITHNHPHYPDIHHQHRH